MIMHEHNLAIAKQNGALLDLQPGELVIDGDGETAEFIDYGYNAPLYVNLRYSFGRVRLPNSELRRAQ